MLFTCFHKKNTWTNAEILSNRNLRRTTNTLIQYKSFENIIHVISIILYRHRTYLSEICIKYHIFIQENTFENVVCEMATISSPQCVKVTIQFYHVITDHFSDGFTNPDSINCTKFYWCKFLMCLNHCLFDASLKGNTKAWNYRSIWFYYFMINRSIVYQSNAY